MTATGSKSIADNESLRISGRGKAQKSKNRSQRKRPGCCQSNMVSENGKFNMNYKEPYSQHFSAHFFETKLRFSGGYHSIHMYPSQLMLTSGFQAVLCATWYAHPVQGRSMEVMVMRKSEPSICTVPANYAFGWDTYPSAISWFMVYIFVCIYYGIYIQIHSIYSTCNVLIYSCFFLWKIGGFGVPLLGLFAKSWKLDAVAIGNHHKGVFKQQPCGIELTGARASRTTHGHGPK